MIRKMIYKLLIFVLLISPISAFAAGSVTVASNELKVKVGEVATFNIDVYNALARATIESSNTSVAVLVDESGNVLSSNRWVSIQDGENKTTNNPIYVRGLNVGTATITIDVYDATSFDLETLTVDKINIAVEVTEAGAVVTTYTVTYNANGGEGAPSAQNKQVDKDLTLSSTKPTRDEYEFINWNTQKNGKGTSYEAGGKYTANADATLFAQWRQTGNVGENPDTGDTLIYVILLLTLGALIYSYWYMKRVKES